jgi:hypothetical protein
LICVQLSCTARGMSPDAAKKFEGVANSIRNDDDLKPLIEFSKQQLSQPKPGNFEPQITAAAQQLAQQVASTASAPFEIVNVSSSEVLTVRSRRMKLKGSARPHRSLGDGDVRETLRPT